LKTIPKSFLFANHQNVLLLSKSNIMLAALVSFSYVPSFLPFSERMFVLYYIKTF